ncbi:MAG TPA: isoprenylcysteine carboxylmethyltransferase family protein [Gammaproteobacteria bacterium]|nr:isoprenylcysteine carboxylmethyltransferase family protein [Gammaproteobacteria bacterium]
MNSLNRSCTHRNEISQRLEDGADDHANVHIPPPLIHLTFILIAVVVNPFFPVTLPLSALLMGAGTGLILLPILIAGSAFRQFARNNNPVPPNQPVNGLMVQGPFRFTRNPLYLALALLQAGVGLISGNGWILMTLPLVLLIVSRYVIGREEAYLSRRFGQAYLEYQSRVRRWL